MAFAVGLRKIKNLEGPKRPRSLLTQAPFTLLLLCPLFRETLPWESSEAEESKAKRLEMVHTGLCLCSMLNHHFSPVEPVTLAQRPKGSLSIEN